MKLVEIREVLQRELVAQALGNSEVSDSARLTLLRRVGGPLVRRHVHRGHRIVWQGNLYGESPLVVERVEEDQLMFEEPRLVIAMVSFCKAVAGGKARDP
jgi:hypothetical protein